MVKENDKVLHCTQCQTSTKKPFVFYEATESLAQKNSYMQK